MTRRLHTHSRSLLFLSVSALSCLSSAQDTHVVTAATQIVGPTCLSVRGVREGAYQPCTSDELDLWLADISHWRDERRIRIAYDDARYRLPALRWTQSSFIQPQAMVHDRYLYDVASHHYTVSRYLDDVRLRYGGIDAVLLWSTYPNLGIDDRNQQEMLLSMPGGLEGVRGLVADFHRAGIRVLFPMMLWDQGTHAPSRPWPAAVAELMKQLDADGVNGDTQDGVPLAFSTAAEKLGHPLAFEPEKGPSDEALAWNVMTWGQYQFPFVPMVDRYKWLESRHMVNISGRWRHDKTDDLQYAFFNGVGWESWENVWGIWNGITPRDAEAVRRVATLERGLAEFLNSPMWQPFSPTMQFGVYSSRWPGAHASVWTIVNRNAYPVSGEQLSLPFQKGTRFLDLYHGEELHPRIANGEAVLSFSMDEHGFGSVAAVPSTQSLDSFGTLMGTMRALTQKPLRSFSADWHVLPQHMAPEKAAPVGSTVPQGMVLVPAVSDFAFTVHGVEIEGGNDAGVDVQYPWESEPRRLHRHGMSIPAFYLDRYPVTNAQFKRFLVSTHYAPFDHQNFLHDWTNGTYPATSANRPVTWVSRDDAEAYARWAGKRLPHEWEWQYAAQGRDGRTYPWGANWNRDAVPAPQRGRVLTHADDVDSHPAGTSPFGVQDMVGNVWQWTDVFEDEHTRAAILRGGSLYQPQGSVWYFPQAYRNDEHGKYLLMAPGMDRAATIGFRCAADR